METRDPCRVTSVTGTYAVGERRNAPSTLYRVSHSHSYYDHANAVIEDDPRSSHSIDLRRSLLIIARDQIANVVSDGQHPHVRWIRDDLDKTTKVPKALRNAVLKLDSLDSLCPSYLETLTRNYPAIGSATGPTCVRHCQDFPPTNLQK